VIITIAIHIDIAMAFFAMRFSKYNNLGHLEEGVDSPAPVDTSTQSQKDTSQVIVGYYNNIL
jgi:hypothetical protein